MCVLVCVCVLFKALTMRSTVQIIYSSAIIFDCCNSKAAPALHVMHIENRSRETPNCPTVRPLCLRLVCSTLVCCLLAKAMACGCTPLLSHTSSATYPRQGVGGVHAHWPHWPHADADGQSWCRHRRRRRRRRRFKAAAASWGLLAASHAATTVC